MAEVATTATTRKATTRKAAARKAPARKAAARKTAARPAAKRAATRATTRKPAVSIDTVSGTVKEVAYVQLGLCGKAYDEVNARMSKVRKDAPKQWTQLVKRGEQVQRDLERAQKDLKRGLKQRVSKIEAKTDLEGRVARIRKAVNKLAARVRKAA